MINCFKRAEKFYNRNYEIIHFSLPATVCTIGCSLLIYNKVVAFLPFLLITIGVILHPLFDFAIFKLDHGYRLRIAIISSASFVISFIIGSALTNCGLVGVVITLVLATIIMLLTGDIDDVEIKASGQFVAMWMIIGTAMPAALIKAAKSGSMVLIGLWGMAIIYYFYYRLLARKIERTTVRLQMVHEKINWHISRRLIRYAIALFVASFAAYCLSIYLSHKLSFVVSAQRAYWASYFVFVMLPYRPQVRLIYSRIIQRFIGTALGLLIVCPLAIFEHNILLLIAVFLPISLLLTLVTMYMLKPYWINTTYATVFAMIFYLAVEAADYHLEVFRFSETLIAALSAFLCIIVLRPILNKFFPVSD